MATEIKLPRLGQGMEAGTIVKWLKSEGENVEKGEPLYELDTDKVTQEVEADASGVLLRIAVQEGEVEVGRTIAIIGEEGEEVPAESPDKGGSAESPDKGGSAESPDKGVSAESPDGDSARASGATEREDQEGSRAPSRDEERARGQKASTDGQTEQATEVKAPSRDGDRIKASPLARRIARERGIDLAQLRGTGPEGRIVAEDVERAQAAPAAEPAAAPGEIEVRELSKVRRTIARRLTQAWEAPVFQLTASVDMANAQSLVDELRELDPDERPTLTDVLTRLTARALMRHRDVNAHYVDDEIHVHPSANVGIAVAAPQGLVVPVIRGAERLTIAEIARVRAEVVGRARDNKLRQQDLEDGTFTISNLGMFGVEQFIAVLNPPQVAILAVGATDDKVVARGGEPVVRPTMAMALTCDHRAIDGAVGAQFLQTLKQYFETPALAL